MAESSKELEWHPDSETMRPETGIEEKFSKDSHLPSGQGKTPENHVYR